jgi:predicted alpha/beta hydrolase
MGPVREELEIRTADGTTLQAVVEEPADGGAPIGTFVLAHAMFARKSTFARGVSALLTARGYRTVAFDFRGHGGSRPPKGREDFGYDDLVRSDVPAVVECARARAEDVPVLVLGHSLGGHVALASAASGRADIDAFVLVACNVWIGDGSFSRSLAERALADAGMLLVERIGRAPARALRLGSDDEPKGYMADVLGFAQRRAWRSRDGKDDYRASLARVRAPIAVVASDGDRLVCPPKLAERFVRGVAGPVEIVRVARADDGGPPPGHMQLVTTKEAHAGLRRAIGFVEERLGVVPRVQERP